MKRQLQQPIEKLLKSTAKPEPDLAYTKNAQKTALLAAVRSRSSWRSRRFGYRFGLHLRSILAISSAGLVIMIGTGAIIAQANQALPGQALYSLKDTFQRTQLALTSGEKNKLSRQIAQAETQLADVVEAKDTDPQYIEPAISKATVSVAEIDDKLDTSRLQIVAGLPSQLSEPEVLEIESEFRTMLAEYDQVLGEIEVEQDMLKELQAIMEVELDPRQEDEGYLVQLTGTINAADQTFSSKGVSVNTVEEMPSLFDGTQLVLTGLLDSSGLSWYELQSQGWLFSKEDGSVKLQGAGLLAESAESVSLKSINEGYEILADSAMFRSFSLPGLYEQPLWFSADYNLEQEMLEVNLIEVEADGQKLTIDASQEQINQLEELLEGEVTEIVPGPLWLVAEGQLTLIDESVVFRLGNVELVVETLLKQELIGGRWKIEGRLDNGRLVAEELARL